MFRPVLNSPLLKNIFKDKNVLVTGGATGLGKNIAEKYYSLGANVIISSRNTDNLKNACNQIAQENMQNSIEYIQMDISNHDSVLNCVETLNNKTLPDIVVNNAAANFLCKTEDLTFNGWNKIVDVVLKGTFDFTLEMGKELIKQNKQSTFVNISALYANTGSAFVVPSAMAKSGINVITQSLSVEWAKHGIRFLTVSPGAIYTEGAFSRLDPSGKYRDFMEQRIPCGRFGEKEELSNLVTFLTTEQCNWLNGVTINLDGGENNMNCGQFNVLVKSML